MVPQKRGTAATSSFQLDDARRDPPRVAQLLAPTRRQHEAQRRAVPTGRAGVDDIERAHDESDEAARERLRLGERHEFEPVSRLVLGLDRGIGERDVRAGHAEAEPPGHLG
jgi:hypothetical protein